MSNPYPPQYPSSNQPHYQPYQSPYPGNGEPSSIVPPQHSYPSPPPSPQYTPQGTPYPYPPAYAPYGSAPITRLSKLAEASLGLAILGLCTGFAAIGAIICGHLALSEIGKPYTFVHGKQMALAGLILGYLEVVLYVIVIVVSMANHAH